MITTQFRNRLLKSQLIRLQPGLARATHPNNSKFVVDYDEYTAIIPALRSLEKKLPQLKVEQSIFTC